MTFLSPLWLALLLPWGAVAAWLLRRRRGERTDVPFLDLWRTPSTDSPAARDTFHVPPLALVAAMTAALLAILAAGRPSLAVALPTAGPPTAGPHITVILDRGLTMSIGDRRQRTVDAAQSAILETFGPGPTTFVPVPDGVARETDRSDWTGLAASLPPTQERTRDAVQFAVRQAVARGDGEGGPVIVLSDQPVTADEARVVRVAPAESLENVGVTRFAVRESPRGGAQAMVSVANQSEQTRGTLRVRTDDDRHVVGRPIDLPRRGGEANYFIDLPSVDATAVAEVEAAGDDIALDNIAHARRQHPHPAIEVRAAVPAEVARVAAAYAKTRPPADTSPRVAVVTEDRVSADLPAAIVASSATSHGAGAIQVVAHPICAGVDWNAAKAQATGQPPGGGARGGWHAVLTINNHPAVAVRESPHRQVWIGLDAPDFARTADFVVFWTNVFDFLAGRDDASVGGTQTWASTVVPPIDVVAPPATDWRVKMHRLGVRNAAGTELAPGVMLGCVICLIVAAAAWPARAAGRRLTAFSTPRTV